MPYPKRDQAGRERPDPPPRGGLRPRSQKMAERMEDDYLPAKKRFLQTHKVCAVKVRGVCSKFARDVHHAAGRTGEALTDESTWYATCRPCHVWLEEHRAWAKEHGFLVTREVKK